MWLINSLTQKNILPQLLWTTDAKLKIFVLLFSHKSICLLHNKFLNQECAVSTFSFVPGELGCWKGSKMHAELKLGLKPFHCHQCMQVPHMHHDSLQVEVN